MSSGAVGISRRAVIGVAAALPLMECASEHPALVASTWTSRLGEGGDVMLELVRLATLAGNSHNSQPWRFVVEPDAVLIRPDPSRRLPVVDGDDHHVWVSLGCAAQNIVEAAPAAGKWATVRYVESDDRWGPHVRVELMPGDVGEAPLLRAIADRRCSRTVYDGKPVAEDVLQQLSRAADVAFVWTDVITAEERREAVARLVIEANTEQMRSAAFVAELKGWLRFNEGDAARTRDGLYTGSLGAPTAPRWVADLFFQLDVEGENRKLEAQLGSSPALAVFTATREGPEGWVHVGRAYQRFALEATRLGVAHAHVNQPVEEASLRPRLAEAIGRPGTRPDLVIRFGYGPDLPRSLRRPVDEVVDRTA